MGLYKNNSGVLAPIAGTPTDRLDALTNNTVKNLLDISKCDSSFNGVTVTKNSDGTITLSGTYGGSTGNWIYLGEYILKAGNTYIVSGSGKISSDDGIIGGLTEKWAGSKITTSIATELYGDGQPYTPETDQLLYFGIRMVSGTNYDGLTYKPMLRLASIKDNSFEPYAMTNAELTQKVNISEHVYINTSAEYSIYTRNCNVNKYALANFSYNGNVLVFAGNFHIKDSGAALYTNTGTTATSGSENWELFRIPNFPYHVTTSLIGTTFIGEPGGTMYPTDCYIHTVNNELIVYIALINYTDIVGKRVKFSGTTLLY